MDDDENERLRDETDWMDRIAKASDPETFRNLADRALAKAALYQEDRGGFLSAVVRASDEGHKPTFWELLQAALIVHEQSDPIAIDAREALNQLRDGEMDRSTAAQVVNSLYDDALANATALEVLREHFVGVAHRLDALAAVHNVKIDDRVRSAAWRRLDPGRHGDEGMRR